MRTLTLEIERSVYGDTSIARFNGKVVMIRGTLLPGEVVDVDVEAEKRDYLIASLREIREPSPLRIAAGCMYFGSCGGCQWQHIPYDRQVILKEEQLMDCLKRQAGLECTLSDSIINDIPWNYRVRGQFKVSPEAAGFFREHSRKIVDIDQCPLMTDRVNSAFSSARKLLKGSYVKELHVTCGDSPLALLKTPPDVYPRSDLRRIASLFMDNGFGGIMIERENKKVLSYGKSYITLDLDNLKYTLSPKSFLQSNWELNQSAIRCVKSGLQFMKGKKVLDLYAGAGNFSLLLGAEYDVTAIEENPFSIEDGIRNAEINSVQNCTFIHSSAERFRSEERFDIIILDPPRPGLTKKAMQNVLSMEPEKIIYISCNPSTLARDLKALLRKYDVEYIRTVDFFPQTYHIESLVSMNLR